MCWWRSLQGDQAWNFNPAPGLHRCHQPRGHRCHRRHSHPNFFSHELLQVHELEWAGVWQRHPRLGHGLAVMTHTGVDWRAGTTGFTLVPTLFGRRFFWNISEEKLWEILMRLWGTQTGHSDAIDKYQVSTIRVTSIKYQPANTSHHGSQISAERLSSGSHIKLWSISTFSD